MCSVHGPFPLSRLHDHLPKDMRHCPSHFMKSLQYYWLHSSSQRTDHAGREDTGMKMEPTVAAGSEQILPAQIWGVARWLRKQLFQAGKSSIVCHGKTIKMCGMHARMIKLPFSRSIRREVACLERVGANQSLLQITCVSPGVGFSVAECRHDPKITSKNCLDGELCILKAANELRQGLLHAVDCKSCNLAWQWSTSGKASEFDGPFWWHFS